MILGQKITKQILIAVWSSGPVSTAQINGTHQYEFDIQQEKVELLVEQKLSTPKVLDP